MLFVSPVVCSLTLNINKKKVIDDSIKMASFMASMIIDVSGIDPPQDITKDMIDIVTEIIAYF